MTMQQLKDFAGAAFKTEVEKALGPMTPNLDRFVQSIERQQAEARASLASTTSGKPDPSLPKLIKEDGQ